MNKFLIITIALLILLLIFFLIPVKEHPFKELLTGNNELEKSLFEFREIPVKKLDVAGAKWNYLSIGNGEKNLLFLHGMGGAYDIWWQQIQVLSNQFRIISTTLPAVTSLEGATGGLLAILDKEGMQKITIIGTSMGGYMAQYFLQKYPERLDELVFGNTFPPNCIFKNENLGIRKILPYMTE